MTRRDRSTKHGPFNNDGHAIGLDLGATSVRAAVLQLNPLGTCPAVVAHTVGSVALPQGAVVNGAVIDQAAVTRALKDLWDSKDFNCSKVILGVGSPQVVVRALQIPNLSAQQRAKALPFQAREVVALPLDEVVLDFAQVGDPDPETGMLNGLLIAIPRRPVLAAVQAVERAGLKVVRVDLSSFGALRAIGDEHLSVQAVIDIGAHLTSIVIHNGGIPQFVRTLAHGGQELTELLVGTLSLTVEDAEKAKRAIGVIGGADSVSSTLETGIRPLLAEIRRSINYFRSSKDTAPLEAISLTGEASRLPGLAEVLQTQNGVPVTLADPMKHVSNRKSGKDAGAGQAEHGMTAVAVGLAIGAAA